MKCFYYKITNASKLPHNLSQVDGLILYGDELFSHSIAPVEAGVIKRSHAVISKVVALEEVEVQIAEDLSKLPAIAPECLPLKGLMYDVYKEEESFQWLDVIARWQNPKVEIECILPGLARTSVGSLISPGGTGKSMLTLQTCVDLALGNQSCLNPKAKALKVAYISVEDQADMVGNRLKDTLMQFEFNERNQQLIQQNLRCVGTNNLVIGVNKEVYPEVVIKRMGDFKPDLLILDTMSRIHRLDENSSGDMAMLLGAFEDIARELDCAVLVLHHTSKGAMFAKAQGADVGSAASRGSSVLVDNARSVMSLNIMSKNEAEAHGVDAEDRRGFVQLTQDKCNIDKWMDAQWFKRDESGLLQEFDFSDAVVEQSKQEKGDHEKDSLF